MIALRRPRALFAGVLACVVAGALLGVPASPASADSTDHAFFFEASQVPLIDELVPPLPFSGYQVASFWDTIDAGPDQIQTTIDWGDGTVIPGTLDVNDGGRLLNVIGFHEYGNDGTYAVTVTVTGRQSGTNTYHYSQVVGDGWVWAPFTEEPLSVVVDHPVSGVLAHAYTDTEFDPDVTVTVDWRDGTTEPAAVQWSPPTGTGIGSPFGVIEASGTHTYTHAGTYVPTVTFREGGNGVCSPCADSKITTITVNKATPDVSVGTQAPPEAGHPVELSALVTAPDSLTPPPTGFVQFNVDGHLVGDPVPLNGDRAVSAPTVLPVGSHSISASYRGDDVYAPNVDERTLVVDAQDATVAVSSSQNPSAIGQPVSFSAFVARDDDSSPLGTIQFRADGAPLGDPVGLDLLGRASSPPISSLAVGTHEVTASFDGDAITKPAIGTLTQTVDRAATTTTATATPSSSTFGSPVTFDAHVAVVPPGVAVPTGTVQFSDGAAPLGGPRPLDASRHATLTTSTLAVGTHTITAAYSGDASSAPSRATTRAVVGRAPTTLRADPIVVQLLPGLKIYLPNVTAHLTRADTGAPLAGEQIEFAAGHTPICSATTNAGGTATCSATLSSLLTTVLALGDRATFAGDVDYEPSSATGPLLTISGTSVP